MTLLLGFFLSSVPYIPIPCRAGSSLLLEMPSGEQHVPASATPTLRIPPPLCLDLSTRREVDFPERHTRAGQDVRVQDSDKHRAVAPQHEDPDAHPNTRASVPTGTARCVGTETFRNTRVIQVPSHLHFPHSDVTPLPFPVQCGSHGSLSPCRPSRSSGRHDTPRLSSKRPREMFFRCLVGLREINW